jgi:molybdopterin-binding protein
MLHGAAVVCRSATAKSATKEGRKLMKISARNIIPGTIVEVKRGATTSHVRLDIGGGNIITSSITNEAVDDLKLVVGGKASAVIKSSEVMIAVA